MILCRVVGTTVAPVKDAHLERQKLLVCRPVELDGEKPTGAATFVAVDVAQAGEGDLVLVNKEGGGARLIFKDEQIPVQTVVVAVIDGIHVDRRELAIEPPARITRTGGR